MTVKSIRAPKVVYHTINTVSTRVEISRNPWSPNFWPDFCQIESNHASLTSQQINAIVSLPPYHIFILLVLLHKHFSQYPFSVTSGFCEHTFVAQTSPLFLYNRVYYFAAMVFPFICQLPITEDDNILTWTSKTTGIAQYYIIIKLI